MSRHRNVRSMNYSEEYEGYDDVYGHSVEDDFCISPSDAAQFIFDRSKQTQISSFIDKDQNIAEEDESLEESFESDGRKRSDSVNFKWPDLNPIDEGRLRSCLEEIRNVIGDAFQESVIINIIIKNNFDLTKSLDALLTNSSTKTQDACKFQDVTNASLSKGVKRFSNSPHEIENTKSNEIVQIEKRIASTYPDINVKIIPAAKTLAITKGFDVINDKSLENNSKTGSNTPTPRTQSPSNFDIDSPADGEEN